MPGRVWLLYRPEPFLFNGDDDRSIHLWIRRCEVFTSRENIDEYFKKLLDVEINWKQHELFPELEIGYDNKGFRWLVTWAELDPNLRI